MGASEDDYVVTGPQLSLVRAGLAPSVWACNRICSSSYTPLTGKSWPRQETERGGLVSRPISDEEVVRRARMDLLPG